MNLLINEPPLLFLPSLAVRIGLNKSIVIQQMHYWIIRSEHVYEGKRWIYNSVTEWIDQFPFWSRSTLTRIIDDLEKDNLIFVGNFNKKAMDRTKWYSINYDDERLYSAFSQNEKIDLVKMTKSIHPNRVNEFSQNELTNTRDYTENTQEKNNSRKQAFDEDSDVVKLVNFFVDEIRKNRPQFKGHSKSWFTDMDKLLRIDKRDPSEVCRVIRFAQADDFWKSNILSVKKLREKYDSLAIKYHQTIEKLNAPKSSNQSPTTYKPVELDLNAGED